MRSETLSVINTKNKPCRHAAVLHELPRVVGTVAGGEEAEAVLPSADVVALEVRPIAPIGYGKIEAEARNYCVHMTRIQRERGAC